MATAGARQRQLSDTLILFDDKTINNQGKEVTGWVRAHEAGMDDAKKRKREDADEAELVVAEVNFDIQFKKVINWRRLAYAPCRCCNNNAARFGPKKPKVVCQYDRHSLDPEPSLSFD